MAREVLPDFYGTTSSALHHGLATDRLFARWELDSPRVARRAAGEAATPPDFDALPALNEVSGRGEVPASSPPRLDLDGTELLLEIPDDWDAVVRADPGLAREWQDVVRRAFEVPLRTGVRGGGLRLDPRPAAACRLRAQEGRDEE